MKFSELHLNGNVLEALDAMRFEECTPIQEQSIPVILEGRDLIAVAQTGTGKTAAYLLPILNKLSEGGHPADAINCIVMAPTRELAQQIDQQMEGFSYFMPVSSVAVYGGNDGVLFEQQKREYMKFSELHLNGNVLEALDAMRFEECTPIQEQSIPVILEGRDLIAVAQTGTGKTAAYLLPILNKLSEGGHPADAINCIVMAPTRELAQQIDQQMEGFSYFMPVSSVAVYGGNDGVLFEQQKRGLTLGADVVIATPGRLIAHLSLGYVDLSRVSYFILDEADRMLDMGFYDDIMQIVKFLPKERQTIMFSATMPAKIQQLAGNILNNPAEVKLAVSKPAEKIVQAAYVCYENQKLGIIRSLFAEETPERVIIFASSKLKVKEVTKALKQMKLNVGEMHSDLEQAQREEVMYEFKAGRINILVATDIVARGIDIDDIRLVINYDVPHDSEDYVHRIGRTARANNDGVAITFVSEKEQGNFKNIEKFLDRDIYKIPVPEELGEAPEYKPRAFDGGRRGGRGNGRKPGGNKNGRNNSKGGKPRAKRPQNGGEKK